MKVRWYQKRIQRLELRLTKDDDAQALIQRRREISEAQGKRETGGPRARHVPLEGTGPMLPNEKSGLTLLLFQQKNRAASWADWLNLSAGADTV